LLLPGAPITAGGADEIPGVVVAGVVAAGDVNSDGAGRRGVAGGAPSRDSRGVFTGVAMSLVAGERLSTWEIRDEPVTAAVTAPLDDRCLPEGAAGKTVGVGPPRDAAAGAGSPEAAGPLAKGAEGVAAFPGVAPTAIGTWEGVLLALRTLVQAGRWPSGCETRRRTYVGATAVGAS